MKNLINVRSEINTHGKRRTEKEKDIIFINIYEQKRWNFEYNTLKEKQYSILIELYLYSHAYMHNG